MCCVELRLGNRSLGSALFLNRSKDRVSFDRHYSSSGEEGTTD